MIRQEVAAACFRSRPRRPPQPKRFSVDPSPGLPPSIRPRRSPRTCPTTPTTPADFRAPPNARPSNPHSPSPLAVAISAARGFPPRRLSDAGPSALAPASVSGRRPKPLTKPAVRFAQILLKTPLFWRQHLGFVAMSARQIPGSPPHVAKMGVRSEMSFASFRRFWAVAANRNSSLAPFGPRRRNRPSLSMRLR